MKSDFSAEHAMQRIARSLGVPLTFATWDELANAIEARAVRRAPKPDATWGELYEHVKQVSDDRRAADKARNKLAERCLDYLAECNLGVREIGRRCGFSGSYVSKFTHHKGPASAQFLEGISKLCAELERETLKSVKRIAG